MPATITPAVAIAWIADADDPADTFTRPYADADKAAAYAALAETRGRVVRLVTTCNDHGEPIVEAAEIGGTHYGHCARCSESWKAFEVRNAADRRRRDAARSRSWKASIARYGS